jgi:hypothetical protein
MNSSSRSWYLDDTRKKDYNERMKKAKNDSLYKKSSEDDAVESLIKKRENLVLSGDFRKDTMKSQQLMAACLGATLLDMETGPYKSYLDKMKKEGSNIGIKVMLFASYNAGPTGAISKFSQANDENILAGGKGTFKWRDAKDKFKKETKDYVPGVMARLPISELKELKDLDLSNAFMSTVTVPDESTPNTKDTKKVDVNNMAMPNGYGSLTQLESLDLSGNYFSTLPSDLKNLVNLTSLNLATNELANYDIVALLSNMKQLTSLDLTNNNFSDQQVIDLTSKLTKSHSKLTVTFK